MKEATTWEECARHVEAGGAVEVQRLPEGDWRPDLIAGRPWLPLQYRLLHGDSLQSPPGERGVWPRRLVPLSTPAPSPSDVSTLVELAALTTDRSPDEQAALERVAAWVDARSGLTIHMETAR